MPDDITLRLNLPTDWDSCRLYELTDSSIRSTLRSADVLPALAFCLLFRFQGAEARGTQLPVGWLLVPALGPVTGCPKRVTTLSAPPQSVNPLVETFPTT